MNPEDTPEEDNCEDEEIQQLFSYKYLLGEMGMQILIAVLRGASTKTSIMMISGVPMACVNGRIPVLINLGLLNSIQGNYFITELGHKFLGIVGQE